MTKRRRKRSPTAGVLDLVKQSVDESPPSDIDVALAVYTGSPTRPVLKSRIVYDLTDGSVDCFVELRDGTKAELRMSAAHVRQPLGPALTARVIHVHTALLLWGVGDPAWHRRDVGRAACLLLAILLPQDAGGFTDALASPERAGKYLQVGGADPGGAAPRSPHTGA